MTIYRKTVLKQCLQNSTEGIEKGEEKFGGRGDDTRMIMTRESTFDVKIEY